VKALLVKLKADLSRRPWQSLLIFITVGGAASLLYLGLVTLRASTSPYDAQMRRTNGSHAWFWTTGGPAGERLVQGLKRLPGVEAATELRSAATVQVVLPVHPQVPRLLLMAVPPGVLPVGDYIVVQGRRLQEGDRGGAVLSASFAKEYEIQVGDTLNLQAANDIRTVRVVGLAVDPMNCQHPYCGPVPIYVLAPTYATVVEKAEAGWIIGVRLHQSLQAERFRIEAQRQTADGAQVTSAWTWLTIRSDYQMTQAFTVLFILTFGLTAVAAAMMITANVVSGAVLGQHRQIGVLKAIGFSRLQVMGLFVGQNLILGLLGSVVGLTMGHLLAVRLLAPLAETMGTPEVIGFDLVSALRVLLLVAIATALCTWMSAWRAGRIQPAEALRNGFGSPSARVPWVVRLLLWLRTPAAICLGVKDVMARPGRVVMTVSSLVLCVVTLTMSITLRDLIVRYQTDVGLRGIHHDLEVDRGARLEAEVASLLHSQEGVAAFYAETALSALAPEQNLSFTVKVLSGDYAQFDFGILQGEPLRRADQILLGPGIMQRLGVKVGDDIRIRLRDQELSLHVVGQFRDTQNLGRTGLMARTALQSVQLDAPPRFYKVRLRPGTDRERVRYELMQRDPGWLAVNFPNTAIPTAVTDLLSLVRLLSWMMGVIAVLSLLNTALLNAKEQMREVGIRKAIGMTPAQIWQAVGSGGAWLGLLGSAIGVPLGVLLNRLLVAELAQQIGVGQLSVQMSIHQAALLLASGVVLAAVTALPAALWAMKLAPAQVLHSE
jgi:putative ABC transport system permease protein